MGTLWRARDPKIGGRTVAIKLLKEGIDNDEIRRRFMQEANAAGVLEHENIVRIFDVGEHNGQPFIAMEYIDGETLSAWIRRREPASLIRKLRLIEELCDGLAYAHSFGIIHRDVKPANLMVERRRGRLKILDFGIAKLADSGITHAGALIGSFNYMSPEQVRGLPIDLRSDIFSVGAVMFELLSYRQAFPGGLADGVLGKIAEQPSPRLSEVMPGADPEVDRIVARALEKDPAQRYQDLSEMHRQLSRVRRRFERDDSAEHTVVGERPAAPRAVHTPTPVGTPRPGGRGRTAAEAERFARIRAEQLEAHLAAAQRAFDAGQFEEAIEHAYRASAVNEADPRPHDLRERAQLALDEQEAVRLIAQGRAALARGDLDDADALATRAREIRPQHPGLAELRQAIARARNQIAASAALSRARASFERREWTAAIRASTEAELHDPGLEEARAIRQRAQAALDEQRRIEAHEQAARHAVAEARQLVSRQEYRAAVDLLAAFAPPHTLVTRELERLRAEVARIEELAARERARQERVRQAFEGARKALMQGAIDEARRFAGEAAAEGADARQLEGLHAEIEIARQQREAAARRQAQLDALVAEAAARLAAGDFHAAIARSDAALRIQPDDDRALGLRRQAQQALDEEEARRQAEEAERRRQEAAARGSAESTEHRAISALVARAIDTSRSFLASAGVKPGPDFRGLLTTPALAVAAIGLLLLVATGWWLFTRSEPNDDTPQTESAAAATNDSSAATGEATSGSSEAATTAAVPPPPAPPGMAPVSIDASPWARVTVTPVDGGDPITCVTPCSLQLPDGDYTVALENSALSEPLQDRISVAAGRAVVLRRTLPGFDVDEAVSSILGSP